ncbi:MAG: FAD-dependent oxidoreductase [Ardenticatenaceae bacterium]
MYDYAIVGNGMIGSAAGRYLSETSQSVVMIGPDEPQGDWRAHDGVFASHYDQGRITRALDSTIQWAIWAQRSLAVYRELEAKSGIKFYHPCGGIQVGLVDGDYIPRTERVALHLGTSYQKYSGAAFGAVCPELKFSDEFTVLHEPTIAGYINPRQLVQAQLVVAQQQGATVVRETVSAIEPQAEGVMLTTNAGQTIRARKVLVAAGAWTEFLIGADGGCQNLGLIPTPRTILLAKLDSAEAQRLKNMPSIVFYEGLGNPHLSGVYLLPPIRYPDGNTYLKIGGKLHDIKVPQSAEELQAWFHTDGNPLEAQELERELFNIVDGLQPESLHVRTCVVTNQKAGHLPIIKTIVPQQVVVAAAGCGAAAKSSNEIGRLAAIKLQQHA